MIESIISDLSKVVEVESGFWKQKGESVHYADLSQEEEILIRREMRRTPWRRVVHHLLRKRNPWLFRIITDSSRSLFLDCIEIPANGIYLDVGSGWGQITIPLARRGKTYALDVSEGRVRILQEIARQSGVNPDILVGNFLSFPFRQEIFDLVVMNGVLEWMPLGAPDIGIREAQLKALEVARRLLKPNGLLYVGIENALGLKYMLGENDDHTGRPYEMFFDLAQREKIHQQSKGEALRVHTWSLREYQTLFQESLFSICQIFGCFPDYKLPRAMIPLNLINQVLCQGMPVSEHGNTGEPVRHIDALNNAYRKLATNGIAEFFCPSYAFVLERQ